VSSDRIRTVWAEHCRCEFELRDVRATLDTMTDDPHLLNVPTGRGGQGRADVERFYTDEFIGTFPDDVQVQSLGLAVGSSRIAEEVVMTFTHDRLMPWILDGIEPTGRQVRIPQLAVVGFRDDLVAFEHIWWDQASVLAQVGVFDPVGLPVVGSEQAQALADLGDRGD
jgi:carboxymethylenebutenolidase